MSEKCAVCGFDEGHFVCSRAPVCEEYNRLRRLESAARKLKERLGNITSIDVLRSNQAKEFQRGIVAALAEFEKEMSK